MIRKFFALPIFQNEDENFRAKFINGFAWVVIGFLFIALLSYLVSPSGDLTEFVLSGLIATILAALLLLRRGYIQASAWTVVGLGWLGIGFQAFTADGVKDVIVMAYIALGLLASIVISHRAGSFVIASSLGVIAFLAFRESTGQFQARIQDPIIYGRDLSFVFLSIAVLIYINTTSLRDAIARATKSEQSLLSSNETLRELNQSLEARVSTRTAELSAANQRNLRRARQFEAIAQVTKATMVNEEFENLLSLLVRVISEKFGYYHTGIFLFDDKREFAQLRAANSDGGRRMLMRGHQLRIGQMGLVGYVAATGTPRIALDVGADTAYFNNPDLPNTHSEMSLPLKAAGNVIGVLDIQSEEREAFQDEDIEVLTILADQVAVALQNARYYQATQKLVEEAQRTAGSYVTDSWRVLASKNPNVGYVATANNVKPADQSFDNTLLTTIFNAGETVVEHGEKPRLAVPIYLAGNVIGVVNIKQGEYHDWDNDEIDIAKAVADRLSLALEAATLLETTQKRAELERLTSDISGRIGSSTQFDAILRTAAEELSRVLGGSEVLVQIQSESLEEAEPVKQA